jgi:DDE superfamily endonuclease
MYVPVHHGVSAEDTSTRASSGLGNDQALNQKVQAAIDSIPKNTSPSTMLILSQLIETTKGNLEDIQPELLINVCNSIRKAPNKMKLFIPIKIPLKDDNMKQNMRFKNQTYKEKHLVSFWDLGERMVRIKTGFQSPMAMLAFIIIVNRGDITKIQRTTTVNKLTWLQEWMVYFEFVWGRSAGRWVDMQEAYGFSDRTVRNIFDDKLEIVSNEAKHWPRFVSLNEDLEIRQQNKWDEYKKQRVIMWDNTNIPMVFKPTAADLQRNTFSAYYASNCAKGGVFIQPCGWMGTHELWEGRVSDTEYLKNSGIIEEQDTYLFCDNENNQVSWTMILDRGYRVSALAYNEGRYNIVQPCFNRSDRKFTAKETLRSAAIANDRSANERAVNLAKNSEYVSTGLKPNQNPTRLNKVWKAWGFQCNFLYKPVC